MKTATQDQFLEAIWNDGRYPPAAYEFLQRGLAHTTRKLRGVREGDEPQHVTGQELCEGLRELALARWGLLARTVLNQWNIHRTRDFGEMVYFFISLELMGRQDSDSIEDFDDVYDFETAFDSYVLPLDASEE